MNLPEECLWCWNDVEWWRDGGARLEVGDPKLGSGELPFSVRLLRDDLKTVSTAPGILIIFNSLYIVIFNSSLIYIALQIFQLAQFTSYVLLNGTQEKTPFSAFKLHLLCFLLL